MRRLLVGIVPSARGFQRVAQGVAPCVTQVCDAWCRLSRLRPNQRSAIGEGAPDDGNLLPEI
jgi:hypothetical protein